MWLTLSLEKKKKKNVTSATVQLFNDMRLCTANKMIII